MHDIDVHVKEFFCTLNHLFLIRIVYHIQKLTDARFLNPRL